jgi:hypothetical protein
MAATPTLDLDSENLFGLVGFKDQILGTYPADAVVTGTLYTEAGAAVTNAIDVAAAYVPGTSGTKTMYRGEFPHTVVLVKDAKYNAKIKAVSSGKQHVFPINGIIAKG